MEHEFDQSGYYHVAYRDHRIMNPISEDRFLEIASHCNLAAGARVLDVGSGKGRAALLLAQQYGTTTICVDISEQWTALARELFDEAGLSERTGFLCMDAETYYPKSNAFDLILCLGTAAIYGNFASALRILKRGLRDGGHIIIGEPSIEPHAPAEYREFLQESGWKMETAKTLLHEIRKKGFHLIHALRSTKDEWDRYMGLQWKAISDYAASAPDDERADDYVDWMEDEQEVYLRFQRHFVDWNILLLRKSA